MSNDVISDANIRSVATYLDQASKENADRRIKKMADDLLFKLQKHARQHQRTGDLARNIVLNKEKLGHYIIDGGYRNTYSDRTYHAIHFFVHEDGKKALEQALNDVIKDLHDNKY